MAKVPMGKVLLRNVIRHTDAHNKIQEESEMWKLRGMEQQTSSTRDSKHKWTTRSSMHCDRYLNDVEGSTRSRLGEGEGVSVRDEQEARYWTRKLYDFEANDPDRWGHSGFKELYPEEFQSDRGADDPKPRKIDKKSKKSSKQKKKKKKKTKNKKQRTEESDSESDSSAAGDVKRKPKRKSSKSKHRRKKRRKEEGDSDGPGEKPHRKRSRTVTDNQREPERKKRKNWKAANEEKSEESSED